MTIKVALGRLYQENEAMKLLLQSTLPAKTAHKLATIARAIHSELSLVEDFRVSLVSRYGEEVPAIGDQPPGKRVSAENMEKFTNEFNEYLSVEIELPGDKISLDDISSISMSAAQISQIDWLIEM